MEVRSTIEDAVRVRLRADVDIGVCISGGIDSSSMLGVVSGLQKTRVKAFHLSFHGMDEYDESQYARIAVDYNNADLNTVNITYDDIADHFGETIWHDEMPFFNAHSVAKLIPCKYVGNAGMRAVIIGEGADEIFGGYPHFRRDMVLYDNSEQDQEIVSHLREHMLKNPSGSSGANKLEGIRWISNESGHGISWLEAQASLIGPVDLLYRPDFVNHFASGDGYRQFVDGVDRTLLPGLSPVHRSMYLLAKSCLPNIVLTTPGDRMEMAGSKSSTPPQAAGYELRFSRQPDCAASGGESDPQRLKDPAATRSEGR